MAVGIGLVVFFVLTKKREFLSWLSTTNEQSGKKKKAIAVAFSNDK